MTFFTSPVPAWLCISIWFVLGCTMIIFNKLLLSTWGFGFPFFLTCFHCVFATVLSRFLFSISPQLFPGVQSGKVTDRIFYVKVVPMALFFSGGLVFSNMAYKYISVAYIQMLKSITPIPMLLASYLTGRERPSFLQLIIVVVVSFGVSLSTAGELHFSLIGFVLQILAIVSDVSRMTILDLFLADFKLDTLSTVYYLAPPSSVFIGVGFYFRELKEFAISGITRFTPQFTLAILMNGSVAFALNLAVVLLMTNTSAMTMSMAGILKDIFMVLASMLVFLSPVTPLQVIGYCLTLCGLSLYRNYKKDAAMVNGAVRDASSEVRGSLRRVLCLPPDSNNRGGEKSPATVSSGLLRLLLLLFLDVSAVGSAAGFSQVHGNTAVNISSSGSNGDEEQARLVGAADSDKY